MMVYGLFRSIYGQWKTSSASRIPKARRYRHVQKLTGEIKPGESVLEVGCGSGADFIQFLPQACDAWGVDIHDEGIERNGFNFRKVDAESLPFEDEISTSWLALAFSSIKPNGKAMPVSLARSSG